MAIVGRSADRLRLRRSPLLLRQREGEHKSAAKRDEADNADGAPPTADIRDAGAGQAPPHAPQRIARDIKAHREPDRRAIHFLDQIGHRDRRNAGERKAGQRPERDERRPIRGERGGERSRPGGGQ